VFCRAGKKNIKPCADTLSVDMKREGKSSMCFAELKHKESTRDIARERAREREREREREFHTWVPPQHFFP
jgi:hypothetical protein